MPLHDPVTRNARRLTPEATVDAARVVEIATRYPEIDIEALGERFGCHGRTIRYILAQAGIRREAEPIGRLDVVDPHPWRPRAPRRRPTMPSMSKSEKQSLVDDFLARNGVTKIPRGAMTTGAVIFLDQLRSE